MELNGKKVDKSSLIISGVDKRDYPDFCDAYFAAGKYEDGTSLEDKELDMLADKYADIVWDMAYASLT